MMARSSKKTRPRQSISQRERVREVMKDRSAAGKYQRGQQSFLKQVEELQNGTKRK